MIAAFVARLTVDGCGAGGWEVRLPSVVNLKEEIRKEGRADFDSHRNIGAEEELRGSEFVLLLSLMSWVVSFSLKET